MKVAPTVEHQSEELGVGGSNPPLHTKKTIQMNNPSPFPVPERVTNQSFVGGPKVHFGDAAGTAADDEKVLPTGQFERFVF